MATKHQNDLPLLANSQDIKIRHFILDLNCNLTKSNFEGSIFLILDRCRNKNGHVFDIRSSHSVCQPFEIQTQLDSGTRVSDGILNTGQKTSSVGTNIVGPTHKVENAELYCGDGMFDSDVNPNKESLNNEDKRTDLTERTSGRLLNVEQAPFTVILDSSDLQVKSVEELVINDQVSAQVNGLFSHKESQSKPDLISWRKNAISLQYDVEEWCIKIWKEDVFEVGAFPALICIRYETTPTGRSLRWVRDQDGRPCVYTAGMWVNNRALMPCQEYGCFSTWHGWVTAPPQYTVLMSADQLLGDTQCEDGSREFGFCSSTPLPSFTLAIAVGAWTCHEVIKPPHVNPVQRTTCEHNPPCNVPFSTSDQLPWRIFAPESVHQRAIQEFQEYLPKCLVAVQEVLGPSPFPRVDIVIYPSSCQDMAMTNPNLLFLSQSMLAGDGSMCIKLAHELSHYWFGLLLGAKDWTEEWLSEGFATFVEDLIHARVMEWSEAELREHSELRAVVRHAVLMAELANTQQDLQYLRPNLGVEQEKSDDSAVMYVKNGMNPRKQFTQLHYLKGYFLLRYLTEKVGFNRFGNVLHEYIKHFHGHMVRSQDFIHLVFNELPELRNYGLSEEIIYRDWLDNSALPQYLKDFLPSSTNGLYNEVIQELRKWEAQISKQKKKRGKKTRHCKPACNETFIQLCADQLVCLLEELLKHDIIPASILTELHRTYHLNAANADVRHRWCEMVVKYRYEKYYSDVSAFLINDQAMGVYLYGELIISRCKKQRRLAENCFHLVQAEMEEGTRNTVHMMIYGEPS